MDKIVLSLNKELNEDYVEHKVSLLKQYFEVLEDDNSFALLRYVTIDARYIKLDFGFMIALQHTLRTDCCVGIQEKFIYEIKVKL